MLNINWHDILPFLYFDEFFHDILPFLYLDEYFHDR